MAAGYRELRERRSAVEIILLETSWLKPVATVCVHTQNDPAEGHTWTYLYLFTYFISIHPAHAIFTLDTFAHAPPRIFWLQWLRNCIQSHPQHCFSHPSRPLGSPGPHRAEEAIKQDAKPVLSDGRDTDLLFLISDGVFYLPDKCQKCHSPSTITLAPEPTFPSPSPSSPVLPCSPPLDCELRARYLQYRSCQSNCDIGENPQLAWILRVRL